MNERENVIVSARGLRKEYGSGDSLVRAVDEVELELARGETLAVMGPSGCGKSTLLHLLGGLDRPTAGELWLNGRRIDGTRHRAGSAYFRQGSPVGGVRQLQLGGGPPSRVHAYRDAGGHQEPHTALVHRGLRRLGAA